MGNDNSSSCTSFLSRNIGFDMELLIWIISIWVTYLNLVSTNDILKGHNHRFTKRLQSLKGAPHSWDPSVLFHAWPNSRQYEPKNPRLCTWSGGIWKSSRYNYLLCFTWRSTLNDISSLFSFPENAVSAATILQK